MRCLTTIACLALLLLVCCGPGGQTDAAAPTFAKAGGVAGNADAAGAEPKAEQQPDAARKVVCTGEMLLRVGELDGARTSVLAATRAAGGYAAEDRLDDQGRVVRRILRVRVPADRFDALVATVEHLGDVVDFHVTAEDVTAQWVDVDARARAKRQMEKRYLDLVDHAKNLAEVMQIEREIGAVRAEIEAMESQLRALGDQVALSTLAITLTARRGEHTAVVAPDFADAMTTGWSALLRCLVVVLTVWPLLVLAALALVLRRMRRPRAPALPAAA